MALDRAFGDFLGEEGVGAGKILSDLLNDKNIDTKTHIVSPVTFAILESVVDYLSEVQIFAKKKGLKETSKFLDNFIFKLKKFLVSWQRLSRKEITETLARVTEQQTAKSLTSRLLGMSGKTEGS